MRQRTIVCTLGIVAITVYLLTRFFLTSTAAAPSAYTPEVYMTVGVQMYELLPDGGYTGSTPTPCTAGNRKWGCTAFCDNRTGGNLWGECKPNGVEVTATPYPYLSSKPTVAIESDYLLDVVSQEMSPSYPQVALEAQAIAARSFAQYYNENPPVTPTQHPYNNSNVYQVFIPYKFESFNLTATPNNPSAPCNSTNLNSSQRSICQAVAHKYYISYYLSDLPAKASFSSDFLGYSVDQTSDKPYFVGVDDPISTTCNAGWSGNPWGMSQLGAVRWAKGDQCAGEDSSMPWSARWYHPEQILFHYFSYVHLRDANNSNSILSPEYRWNPLSLSMVGQCPTIMHKNQSCTFTFLVQNTGTTSWLAGQPIYLWFHGWESGTTTVMRQETQTLPVTVLPGKTISQSIPLTPPDSLRSGGSYILRFEMGLEIPPEYIWEGFSNHEPEHPWFTYNIPVCIDDCRIFLPLIVK